MDNTLVPDGIPNRSEVNATTNRSVGQGSLKRRIKKAIKSMKYKAKK